MKLLSKVYGNADSQYFILALVNIDEKLIKSALSRCAEIFSDTTVFVSTVEVFYYDIKLYLVYANDVGSDLLPEEIWSSLVKNDFVKVKDDFSMDHMSRYKSNAFKNESLVITRYGVYWQVKFLNGEFGSPLTTEEINNQDLMEIISGSLPS